MGYIKIKLAEYLEENGISKNSVCYNCQLQRTQLNKYCNEKMQRVDLQILAKLCEYLGCKIEDILEYVEDKT